jgi:hypothetical protein
VNGKLLWFNPDKRYGFIRSEDGERLRVEEAGFEPGHLLGDRCAGTPLIFERVDDADGARAEHVTVVEFVQPRRARRRH